MKRRSSPTIKAHLLRGAFYLLSVLALCVIPFTLAQRTQQAGPSARNQAPTASRTAPTILCGKIYNIGGFGASGLTNTTRIYCTCSNSWTTGAPCPVSLSEYAIGFWDGLIFVAGGFDGVSAVNTLYEYIPPNFWTTLAPMPAAVHSAGFGVINGKFYVASGNDGSGEVNTLYIYDIPSNTWYEGAAVPLPVTGPGSAVLNGRLYLFGGGAPFPMTTTTTQMYDPVNNTWTICGNMNVARLWFYGGAIDNTSIVAPGGDTSPGVGTNVNEQGGCGWMVKAPMPYNARGAFVVSDGTFAYVGGGFDGTNVHADLLRYDPVADTWTNLAPSGDGHYLSPAVIGGYCGTPTPTPSEPPNTPTATPTSCGSIMQIGGGIVPGTTDIGNHCDDCVTTVLLPFPFTLYDRTFTAVNLSSNGNAQFTTMDPGSSGQCLPWTDHNYTIFPYWDDLYLVNSGYGIYTSISGTAPNRIFNIEWRAQYFPGTGTANFELRLYEGQARFDVIYGTATNGNLTATAGVQRDNTCFAQYFCNGSGPPPIGGWTIGPAGTPTPTATATPTATPTLTATVTPTPSEPPCSVFGSQPACDSIVFTQLTDFVVNIFAPVDPTTVQPSDFRVNGIPADSDMISGGGETITFHFNASPVGQGLNLMDIPAGAFACLFTGRPFEHFSCSFTYQPPTPTPTPRLTPSPRSRPTPRPRP